MAFIGATLFVMIAGIALIYRLTAYFGFRLKLSALVLCAVAAFAVNFTAIMLSPYLTEQHYIRLVVLATVAAAIVTMYNEFLLMREERAAQEAVISLPLTDAERDMARPALPEVATEKTDETEPTVETAISVSPRSPIETLKAFRKKAFARREKVEKIREQNADYLEKNRMDDLAKRREEEKRRLEEERRLREESQKREQERREMREQRKREQDEEKKRLSRAEDEQKREQLLREQAMRAERERQKREEEEKRQAELARERQAAEERRRNEERERRERERRLRELEEEQKRLEEEKQKREAAQRLRRVKTLDELLDEAVSARGRDDRPAAVTALSTALRLYADDDYAPFVAIDMANIFKESGDYKAAVGAHLKALNLPAVKNNPDMRREFDQSINYLRRVDEILSKHHAGGTPFSRIPAFIMREIDGETQN